MFKSGFMESTESHGYDTKLEEFPNIPVEDRCIIENLMEAIESLSIHHHPVFSKYKLDIVTTGYILKAKFPHSDVFEISLDDVLFLKSISPARIENIIFCRNVPNHTPEMHVKVLDHNQKVMITSSVNFSCTRKRKFSSIS